MRKPLLATGTVALLAFSGCVLESNLTPGHTAPSRSDRQPVEDHHDDRHHEQVPAERGGAAGHAPGGGSAGHARGGGGYDMAYHPDCRNPANHCLDDNDLFSGTRAFDDRRRDVNPSVMQSEPDTSGEARFMVRRGGENRLTRHYWGTRVAHPDEVHPGHLLIYFRGNSKDGLHHPPSSRDNANNGRWSVSRVITTDSLQNNYVVVVGRRPGHTDRIHVTNLRLLDGDDSPTTNLQGPEDAHFFRNHYVGIGQFRDDRRRDVAIMAPIREPSAETHGEGHFLSTRTGEIAWTDRAFRTRPATADDIQLGQYIVYYRGNSDNSIYQPPGTRRASLRNRWSVARVIDDSRLFRGMVQVSGRRPGHTDNVAIEAARVILSDEVPHAAIGETRTAARR